MIKVLIPLPDKDFDPTEVAIPWQIMKAQGIEVSFATHNGAIASCDPLMISGEGLDPWGWVPLLKKIRFIGLMLRAEAGARKAYASLENDANFRSPLKYADLSITDFDGLLLPGGHAPNMKQYLESKELQSFVARFFESKNPQGEHKPVAAICHGVILAARSISPVTKKSVLFGKKTTALTWKLEKSAWLLSKYFARFWDANYYRTYQETEQEPKAYWSVEQEVKRALSQGSDFLDVAKSADKYFTKSSGLFRDSMDSSHPAWVVEDGNYLSARWPGDAHTLAKRFVDKLMAKKSAGRPA